MTCMYSLGVTALLAICVETSFIIFWAMLLGTASSISGTPKELRILRSGPCWSGSCMSTSGTPGGVKSLVSSNPNLISEESNRLLMPYDRKHEETDSNESPESMTSVRSIKAIVGIHRAMQVQISRIYLLAPSNSAVDFRSAASPW